MYAGVPTTWVSPLAWRIAFATPRSATITRTSSPSLRSSRFAGLMSRWIDPWWWSTDEPGAGLRHQVDRAVERQPVLALEQVRDRALVGVRHDEVRRAVHLAHVVHADDVVGVGPTQDPRLLQEPVADVEPLRPVVRERLHRDVGLELVVVVEPDRGEPADAQPVAPVAGDRAEREGTRWVLCRTSDRARRTDRVDDTHETEDIESLAARAARGDHEALESLLVEIQPRVRRICGRMLLYPEDAEEAAQDALLLVATRIHTFGGRSRFTTWLHAVASNSARSTYRTLKRRSAELPSDDLPTAADPRTTSVIAGSRLDFLEALELLSVDHPALVEPLVLRDVQELEYADIATLLDIPVGTVKSRIHSARQIVQPLLTR